MAYPVIRINNVTGSDTQASGAGPDPAIYGMQAMTDSAGTTVDLSMDYPDLSGVATDGSHVIWLGGTGGREFAPIVGVDNTAKTVTVGATFPASLSGLQWAIGGKRQTFSQKILDDISSYWKIQIDYTGNEYTAPDLALTTQKGVVIYGSGGKPIVRTLVKAQGNNTSLTLRDLDIRSTGAGYGDTAAVLVNTAGGGHLTFVDCVVGPVRIWYNNGTTSVKFVGCEIHSNNASNDNPVEIDLSESEKVIFTRCTIHGPMSSGTALIYIYWGGLVLDECILTDGIRGIYSTSSYATYLIKRTVVENITWEGLLLYGMEGEIIDTIVYGCGGNGIVASNPIWFKNIATGSNTSGNSFGDAIVENNIVLTEDPFVDRFNGNYSLNDAPGGGKLLKDAGWPQTWPGLPNTTSYPDIGAVESQAGAGSSSGPPILIPVPTRRGWI